MYSKIQSICAPSAIYKINKGTQTEPSHEIQYSFSHLMYNTQWTYTFNLLFFFNGTQYAQVWKTAILAKAPTLYINFNYWINSL